VDRRIGATPVIFAWRGHVLQAAPVFAAKAKAMEAMEPFLFQAKENDPARTAQAAIRTNGRKQNG
jgi:hypothetical protein